MPSNWIPRCPSDWVTGSMVCLLDTAVASDSFMPLFPPPQSPFPMWPLWCHLWKTLLLWIPQWLPISLSSLPILFRYLTNWFTASHTDLLVSLRMPSTLCPKVFALAVSSLRHALPWPPFIHLSSIITCSERLSLINWQSKALPSSLYLLILLYFPSWHSSLSLPDCYNWNNIFNCLPTSFPTRMQTPWRQSIVHLTLHSNSSS